LKEGDIDKARNGVFRKGSAVSVFIALESAVVK